MRGLSLAIDGMELPAIEKISESQQEDPFQVLIATLLSARTQDATTLAASRFESRMTTAAPSEASRRAVAAPIPEAPPVMTAVFPVYLWFMDPGFSVKPAPDVGRVDGIVAAGRTG